MFKFLKKIIVLTMVASILGVYFVSYSAVVSDNDGSAFITKGEFDEIKNNFKNQIDGYNNSISEKIDGAIASYISGTQLVSATPYPLINSWNYVYFMGMNVAPTFRIPEVNSVYCYTAKSAASAVNLKQLIISGIVKNEFKWDTTSGLTCLRPLFGLLTGTEKTPGDMYWRGVAQRYHEKWDVSWTKLDIYSDLGYLNLNTTYSKCSVKIIDAFRFDKNGYVADLTTTAFFNPTSKYTQYDKTTYSDFDASSTSIFRSQIFPKVSLEEYNGKNIDYEHIVQYDKTTTWDLSNEKFQNTFMQHASNTYTDTNLYNSRDTTLSKENNMFTASTSGTDSAYAQHGSMGGVSHQNSSVKLSSIGMLGSGIAASTIYQLDTNDKKVTVNKKTFDVLNKTLEAGFQLCASTKDTDVEWMADFSEVYAYNGTTYVTNANEVDIYVSYVPFSDKVASTDLIKFKDASGSYKDYATTSGRKVKLKWEQTKDSVVYIKCVPHFTGTSYIDKDWKIKLDLTGDSKYFYIYDKSV